MLAVICKLNISVVCLMFALDLANCIFLPTQALSLTSGNARALSLTQIGELAEYKPPKEGFGGTPDTVGGATRGGSCGQDPPDIKTPLTALMPNLIEDPLHGATGSESPQFFVYLPQTSAQMAEFVLKDADENDLYRTTIPISGETGIVRVSLPENIQLQVNQNYLWYFSLICNPENLRENVSIKALTRRIELDPALKTQLEKADPLTRSKLYAEAGIWHEALATLAQLHQESPNDPTVVREWKILLESAGLSGFAEMPMGVTAIQGMP